MLTSRFLRLSLFAVVTAWRMFTRWIISYLTGNLTAAEQHWKKWVCSRVISFWRCLICLIDLQSRSAVHVNPVLHPARDPDQFHAKSGYDQFLAHSLRLVPLSAYLTFGLVVSLLSSVVVLYYFYTYNAFIPTVLHCRLWQASCSSSWQLFSPSGYKKATFQNQEIIEELSRSNIELRTYIEDLSRLSIMEERVQLSNDLHDSIGH